MNDYYEFTHTHENSDGEVTECIISFEAESLKDVISEFNNFLKGCGFEYDGYLDIVEDEDYAS